MIISKNSIKQAYSSIAQRETISSMFSCCDTSTVSKDVALKIGYTTEEIHAVPAESNQGLGCGAPISEELIKEGNTVLDLGSGAGFDSFLAAKLIGSSGKVIGVDFSEDMINKATVLAASNGYKNVDFRLGDIEQLPVNDNSVDVVTSNCVINLSLNKEKVFDEAYRVLTPEGKLVVSDILLLQRLPESIKNSFPSYIACVSGAMLKEEYIAMMQNSGFNNIQIISEQSFPLESILSNPSLMEMVKLNNIPKELVRQAVNAVVSIKFLATK